EIELGGLLVVVGVGDREALAEIRLRELAEHLEGTHGIGRLGKQIAAQQVPALAVAVAGVVAAKLVVVRKLAFDRDGATAAELLLEQEVRARCRVAVLSL